MPMRPCFIISLPRAGSTLLQRLLSRHARIRTIGEPWLALPFAYALRDLGVRAEYSHHSMTTGFQEYVASLPKGAADYFEEVGRMILALHDKLSQPGQTWFLDKTPRYYLILSELQQMFPTAKFLVLHRNPLAVVASIMSTWKRGRFRLKSSEIDVYEGPIKITEFVQESGADLIELGFEDLVSNPAGQLKRITDFLEIDPLPDVKLPEDDPLKSARLGDKTGIHKFQEISRAPLTEWLAMFASPARRAWARKYLAFLGEERLRLMGCNLADLLEALNQYPWSWKQIGTDLIDFNRRLPRLLLPGPLDFTRVIRRRDNRPVYQWRTG